MVDGEDVGEEMGAGAGEDGLSVSCAKGEATIWFAEDAEVVELLVFGGGADDRDIVAITIHSVHGGVLTMIYAVHGVRG